MAPVSAYSGGASLRFDTNDPLDLTRAPRVHREAFRALEKCGAHPRSRNSDIELDRLLVESERKITKALDRDSSLLVPSGEMALRIALQGAVQPTDVVMVASDSPPMFRPFARLFTRYIEGFNRNDLTLLEAQLQRLSIGVRTRIVILMTSLPYCHGKYSSLCKVLMLAKHFDVKVILDVSHDFTVMGKRGRGLLEQDQLLDVPHTLFGDFQFSLPAAGAFIATKSRERSQSARRRLSFGGGLWPPIQARSLRECLRIALSDQGARLRHRLIENVMLLRSELIGSDVLVENIPAPHVLIATPEERLEHTLKHLSNSGIKLKWVPFPVARRGQCLLVCAVSVRHTSDDLKRAATSIAESLPNRTGGSPPISGPRVPAR